jgi:hypothetical protein
MPAAIDILTKSRRVMSSDSCCGFWSSAMA